MPHIRLSGVSHQFVSGERRTQALAALNLDVQAGEFVALVGPSGCGKTTVLNLIAGLQTPSRGEVCYGGQPVQGVNTRVGYMTQKDNLLPWRTVHGNVGIALEVQRRPKDERERRVTAALDLVGLTGFAGHFPRELSGGMRKRVALARTLIYEPETVLFDEPFGAVDAQLKLELQDQLLGLWERRRPTVLFVTHDLIEAVTVADRVVVLSARPGRILLAHEVPLPRPRDVFRVRLSASFAQSHAAVWSALQDEFERGRAA